MDLVFGLTSDPLIDDLLSLHHCHNLALDSTNTAGRTPPGLSPPTRDVGIFFSTLEYLRGMGAGKCVWLWNATSVRVHLLVYLALTKLAF